MQQIGEPLQQKLAITRRWWRATRILAGLAWCVGIVIALSLICYHVDRALVLSSAARQGWRIGIGLAGLGTLLLTLLRPILRPLPDRALAVDVERRYPVLRERLLTAIELGPTLAATGPTPGSQTNFSRPMIASLASETERAVADLDFRRAVNVRPLRTALLTAGFTLVLLALHLVFVPQAFANWVQRMAHPYADIAPYANTRLWVLPEADVLPRGEGLSVRIMARGVPVNACALYYHQEGDPANDWRRVDLDKPESLSTPTTVSQSGTHLSESAQRFHYHFPALTHSLELYAAANDGRSNARQVMVEDRPTILKMRLTLHYPAYTRRGIQVLSESNGNIAAPVGTLVDVEATANKPLRRVGVLREGESPGSWKVEDEKALGQIAVWKDGSYALNLTDRRGFANAAAPRYDIRALPDQPPSVQITRPATDLDLVPDGSLPLVARATDDYGVDRMSLVYDALRGEDDPERQTKPAHVARGALALPGPTGAPQAQVAVRWHIGEVKAKPGDSVVYEVRATDNDTLQGPHTGRSLAYRIHVVSLPEMQQRLKTELEEEARALAQLRLHQIQAQQMLAQARQKPTNAALSRAQDAQRAAAQEAHPIAQRLGELTAQLQNNNLIVPSEQQRRDNAEQLLQNLAQQKMPAAADTIQPHSLTQANQKEGAIRQDIEHAQQLLSRMVSPDQLAEEAARLAKEQQRLADTSRSLGEDMHDKQLQQETRIGMQTQRQQQAQANADTRRLQNQLEQAAKAAQERGESQQAQALRRAAQALRQGNVAANQQRAQNALQRSQPNAAAPPQDRAAAALQKAAESAQQAAQQNPSDTPQSAADRLEQAAERLREMAQQQRKVAEQVAQNPNAQQNHQLAQTERSLQQQANQMQQSLNNATNAQHSLQNAQQSLSQSGQQLSQNQPQSAQSPAQNARQQLERAAQQAAKAAEQLRQQQAAAALRERVERLAQVQHGLEKATQRLQSAQQKHELSSNEQRELNQLAARQERIENESHDLADQFPSPAFKQALRMASRQMHPATQNLNQEPPVTNEETQGAQDKAARTLDAITQALKQQAQGSQQGNQQAGGDQGDQSGSSMSPQEAQAAEALGELMLSRGLQQELRQDTNALDTNRAHNPNQTLTQKQQQEANQLTQGQRDAQGIAQHAGEALSEIPGVGENIAEATRHMGQATQQLSQQQTGRPTQGHQDEALHRLDQAINQTQQAMQQQQQQQQAMQQAQQGAPQPNQHGSRPDQHTLTRLEGVQHGAMSSPDPRIGKGFGALTPRAQRTLREGEQERVPVEYQELVDRYYKSLAEKHR
jgi:hypothetical protein